MSCRIAVPTLNDDLEDFDWLFKLWQDVDNGCLDVHFTFSQCRFLRQNAVSILGGITRQIEARGGKVTFGWDSLCSKVVANLAQNGFMSAFGYNTSKWEGNSIPYREDYHQDKDSIVSYLQNNWIRRSWVNFSQPLTQQIVGTVSEIYINSFEHGDRPKICVFSCGQYYPNLRELKLTAVDFGVGIPTNVKRFLGNNSLQADETLKWAFQKGKTTRPKVAGGAGLDILKSFIKINSGSLEVFSHDGYVNIDKNGEKYQCRSTFFNGTIVNITIKCDEKYYTLPPEIDHKPLF